MNYPIKLLDEENEIIGSHPVAIIGPNGSGKTTFGNKLSISNNGEWISATRNLDFADSIQMNTPEQTASDFDSQKTRQKNSPWRLSSELNHLLAKIKAEDAQSAINFRNAAIVNPGQTPEDTKVLHLTGLWNAIFPEREIDFTSYNPKVTANHVSGTEPFGISKMSGGERVALYLLARIIDSPNGLIFVDEPEIHFHSVLAKEFWNTLENFRSGCRFIYITHDLHFALSRRDVQFIIVSSETDQRVLEQANRIPPEIFQSVLGAATFSISTNKVVFCEGAENNNMDDVFYSAWFNSPSIAVVPVGSCEEVIKCVDVFNNNPVIQGATAIGIIDRDYRSDNFITQLPENITILPVHEFESLFCIKMIFMLLGKRFGKPENELSTLYQEAISQIISRFSQNETEIKKIVLERVKQRTELQLKNMFNSGTDPTKSYEDLKTEFLNAVDSGNWVFSPEDYFEEEKTKMNQSISNVDIEAVLELIPGKSIVGIFVKKLGLLNLSSLLSLVMQRYWTQNQTLILN